MIPAQPFSRRNLNLQENIAMMEIEPKPKQKEVVIVIDDPRTGRAHLEFPDPKAAVPESGVTPVPESEV